MPAYLDFETNTPEKMEAFEFDDPRDDRRYLKGGDNQVAGVGDGFARDLPPWMIRSKRCTPTFRYTEASVKVMNSCGVSSEAKM